MAFKIFKKLFDPNLHFFVPWLWYFKKSKMSVHLRWYLYDNARALSKIYHIYSILLFKSQSQIFTKLLNSEIHTQMALSTVLLDLGVTVKKTGKLRAIFLSPMLLPFRYLFRMLNCSDSSPNFLLKFKSLFIGKLSKMRAAVQARCRGGTSSRS